MARINPDLKALYDNEFLLLYVSGYHNGRKGTDLLTTLEREDMSADELHAYDKGYLRGIDDRNWLRSVGAQSEQYVPEYLMHIAAENGALKHACKQALELLQNPEAEDTDADRVIRLIEVVLSPVSA